MDIDLDNNGGGNNSDAAAAAAAVVSRYPDPADRQMREPPPFTWLRAAPYIVAVLTGIALMAIGVSHMLSHPCPAAAAADAENKPPATGGCFALGFVLAVVGVALVVLPAYVTAAFHCDYWLCCVPRPRRLDQAADD